MTYIIPINSYCNNPNFCTLKIHLKVKHNQKHATYHFKVLKL